MTIYLDNIKRTAQSYTILSKYFLHNPKYKYSFLFFNLYFKNIKAKNHHLIEE